MKKVIPFLALFLITFSLFAQNQANIWYFGHYAGLDFNGGDPVALTDGALETDEGVATISDYNGNLLFYTDGKLVWNKSHQIMPNGTGLLGHKSSTQSAVIVPKPGDSDIYFIFTVDFTAGNGGMAYSEVDMNLNGGLGDVTGNKNIQLITPSCEKITAVQHENEKDIWVIGHEWNSNSYRSWLVTENGVNGNAVISNTGMFIGNDNLNSIGYLKAAPDGSKIAAAHWHDINKVEIFQFNNATGVLSNPTTLDGFGGAGVYGVEFSPDGNLLYASERSYDGRLFQFDMTAGSTIAIQNSRVTLATYNNRFGALQLGPNGKIYVAKRNNPFLAVINDPDVQGVECNYESSGVYLGTGIGWIGLPTFVQSFFIEAKFSFEGVCPVFPTQFTIEVAADAMETVSWDFGDPASGADNFSTELNPSHHYTQPGTYEVTLTVYNLGDSLSSTQEIIITQPTIDLGEDVSICEDEQTTFDATTPTATYLWSNNATTPTLDVDTDGEYWVEITVDGCPNTDTVLVEQFDNPVLVLENETICEDEQAIFDATTNDIETYTWNTGASTPTLTTAQPGTYTVTITSVTTCSAVEEVALSVNPLPVFSLGQDTEICDGETLSLDVGMNGASYLWQNGSTNSTLTVTESGNYTVDITVDGCTSTDEIVVDVLPIPTINLQDQTICQNETSTFDATGNNVVSYLWNNNASTSSISTNQAGMYSVTVTGNNMCTSTATAELIVNPLPVVELGTDTYLCEGETMSLSVTQPNANYTWQDGSTDGTLLIEQGGTYSVEVSLLGCIASDEIEIEDVALPTVDLGIDTALCIDDALSIDVFLDENTDYEWQDGTASSEYTIDEPGVYWVQLTNICGTVQDELLVTEKTPPTPMFIGTDTLICDDEEIFIDARNNNTTHYLWQDGSSEEEYMITEAGLYSITWANICGYVSESIEVETRTCECPVTYPNVFTPNGDGNNDEFNTVSPCDFFKYDLKIFSRWGDLVFHTNDPAMASGWDGNIKGQKAAQGVYVFVVQYEHEFDGGVVSGDVTVLR